MTTNSLVTAAAANHHHHMSQTELTKTDAVTVRRKKERASYTRAAANAILDEALVAHVGFVDNHQPVVIPMAYGRDHNRLILHGSTASRLQKTLKAGVPVCVTVTLVDSVVLARSQFHTSMDYRSVVIIGAAKEITDPDDKRAAMTAMVEHVAPGRSSEAREPTETELRQITVLEVPIDTASVKARTDGVVDDEEDMDLDVWAGVVPVRTVFEDPIAEPNLAEGTEPAGSVSPYRRPATRGG